MSRRYRPDVDAPTWRGGYYPYDILKEGTIALLVVVVLTVTLAVLFGSPDEPAITLKNWASADPIDFAQTAFGELSGTTTTAQYGAPYNASGPSQHLGFLQLNHWAGVRIPINTAEDFVLKPLASLPTSAGAAAPLVTYEQASPAQRVAWQQAYAAHLASMTVRSGTVSVPTSQAGPVPALMQDLTAMARSGALDQSLITNNAFYTTNYTQTLLFLSDGTYLASLAQHQHLLGTQWGMMNETGNYPGQAWLWLYTFWYQVSPFNTSSNGDLMVWATMMVLSGLLLFLPFIPGLRSLPRRLGLYKLIWREHYRQSE